MAKIVYTNRNLIITSFVVLACFLLSVFFPTQGVIQNLVSLATFLVLIPLLYIKLILKEKASDYGIQLGDWKRGIVSAAIALVMSLLVLYIIINHTPFLDGHSMIKILRQNFWVFLRYELFFITPLIIIFDLFFRGFIMHSFKNRFYHWSAIIQFIAFILYLAVTRNFNWDMSYYVIGAFFSGFIVYQSRSLIYSTVFTWIFILISDAVVIRLIK